MKSYHMPFTTIFTYFYNQNTKHFVTIFIKTHHVSENMKIWPHNLTEETRWGHIEEPRTSPSKIFSSPLKMHRRTLLLKRPKNDLSPCMHHYLIY